MQRNYMDRIGDESEDRAYPEAGKCYWPNGVIANRHNVASDGICTDCGAYLVTERATLMDRAPLDDVRAAVAALRPAWRVDVDYPDVLSIYPEWSWSTLHSDGPVFVIGTANETWAGDFYPNGEAQEEGHVFVGFDTGITDEHHDVATIANAVVEDVERYMERRAVRGEFIARMHAFVDAAAKLSEQWEKLDEDDNPVGVEKYPFGKSFDELVHDMILWREKVIAEIGEEYR